MENINKICIILVIFLIAIIIGYTIGNKNLITKKEVIIIDTTYNKVILDSIEYNIKKKDSIIVELKNHIEYEVEQALNANDSITIELFKQYAGSK